VREGGPLVGTGRLVSYTDTAEGATPIHAFGADPIGLFSFTADGHVSVSIMRNPPDPAAPTRTSIQTHGKTVHAERILVRESPR